MPDHVAVDETVIRIDDEQYWLYAAIDPESNELLHTKLEPTRTNALAVMLFGDLREKHGVADTVFLVDDTTPLK